MTTAYLSVQVGIVGSMKDNDKHEVEKMTPRKTHAEVQQAVASRSPNRPPKPKGRNRKKKTTSSDEDSSGSESLSSSSASSSSESESDSDSVSTITNSRRSTTSGTTKSGSTEEERPKTKGGGYFGMFGGRKEDPEPEADEPEVSEAVLIIGHSD